MNKIKLLLSILGILFGIFMVVFGEYDDSPGAQGLGLLLAIACIFYIIRSKSSGIVIEIEFTVNRWGFGRIAENKFQFLCFRFSKVNILNTYSISFGINWQVKDLL